MTRAEQIREQAQGVLDVWFGDFQDENDPHISYQVVTLAPPAAPGSEQFIELRPRGHFGEEASERYMIEMRVVRIP